MDRERQRITLKIGNKKIVTTIARKDEEYLKQIEKALNQLWEQFKLTQPGRQEDEYIALVAFQYAKMHYDTLAANQKRETDLKQFVTDYERRLNEIILNIEE